MSSFLGWAWVPFLAAFWWLATILALLILWLVNDTPHYKQDDADIVYISDVGAKYKTLFIVGTSLTSAFFVTSLLLDYILRKAHRLSAPIHPRARINAILSILFGMIAGAALIGLAVMDVHNHGTVHWTLTLVFMGCLSVSAIFTVAEFKRLKNDHHGKSQLKRSFFVKAMIVVLAVAAVIAMVVLRQLCRTEDWRGTPDAPRCNALHSASAICEWVVALLFVVYLLTLVVDIRQAVYTSKTYMDEHPAMEAIDVPALSLLAVGAAVTVSTIAFAYYKGWLPAALGKPSVPTEAEREILIADLIKDTSKQLGTVKKTLASKKDSLRKSKILKKKAVKKPEEAKKKSSRTLEGQSAQISDQDDYEAAGEEDSIEDLLVLSTLAKSTKPKPTQSKEEAAKAISKPKKKVQVIPEKADPISEEIPKFAESNPARDVVAPAADEYSTPASASVSQPDDERSVAHPAEPIATEVVSAEAPLEEDEDVIEPQENSSVQSSPSPSLDSRDVEQANFGRASELQNQLQHALSKVGSMEKQLSERMALIASLRHEQEELASANTLLASEIDQARRQSQAAQRVQSEMAILRDTNRVLTQSLTNAQLHERDAKDRAIKAVQSAELAEKLRATIRNLEANNRELQAQLEDRNQQVDASRRKALEGQSALTSKLENALQIIQQELAKEREDRAVEQRQAAQNSRKISDEYEARLAELTRDNMDRDSQLEEHRSRAESLSRELSQATKERDVADNLKREMEHWKERYQTETERMAEELHQERKLTENVRQQAESGEKIAADLRRRVEDLVAQTTAVDEKAKAVTDDLEAKDQEIARLKEELKASRAEAQVAHKELVSKQAEVSGETERMAEELRQERERTEDLRQQVKSGEERAADLKRRVEELGAEAAAVDEKTTAVTDNIEAKASEIEQLKKDLDSSRAEMRLAQRELESKQSLAGDLEVKIEQVKKELEASRAETELAQKELEAKSAAVKDLGAVNAKLAEASKVEHTLNAEVATLKQELAAKNAELAEIRAGDKVQIASIEQESAAVVESLQKKLDLANEKTAQMEQDLAESKIALHALTTDRTQYAATLNKFQSTIEVMTARLQGAETANKGLEELIEVLQKRRDELEVLDKQRTEEMKAQTNAVTPASPPPSLDTTPILRELDAPATSEEARAAPEAVTEKPYTFVWKHGGNNVFVTGSFNDWNPNQHAMTQSSDLPTHFELTLPIPVNQDVLYKFVVDGNWRTDLEGHTQRDGTGMENNVAFVQ
ncbi:hypothetical protein PhCBS80983_g02274 [Powellomyces hirtus]|uniref:Uncharacterized protein n=1 Tax=Powellomyces hirtus TaxID=109895 RepID=A0A507E974_9FUNG|nr:hypothetical protein PhCBS80983_g02274 [Powellomyces hirtus]